MITIQAELFKKDNEFIILKTNNIWNDLQVGNMYNINFKKYHTNRSLQQNAMMWSIIQLIADETQNDEIDVYAEGLEKANCAYEYLMILPEALESVKKAFRAIKILESRDYNGKQMLVIKCFIGSSKYNVEEMNKLIEYFMQLAAELNINIRGLK